MAEYDRGRQRFLSIKEAAVQYEVSRAKVHRLIRAGHLRVRKDPRDQRVTLLRQDELDTLFVLPEDTAGDDMNYQATRTTTTEAAGRLTAGMRARVDALRGRAAARGVDSTTIIREERDRRSEELGGAVSGS